MKKFSLISVFFAISIISVFIFSFPAKAKAQVNLDWPAPGRITSCYGFRCIYEHGCEAKKHIGIDISDNAKCGDPVRAVYDGEVTWVNSTDNGGYGKDIIIKHDNLTIERKPLLSFYAHLNSVNVTSPQTVHKGDVIGYVGSTGLSGACHLHFGLYEMKGGDTDINDDYSIDPLIYLFYTLPGDTDSKWTNYTGYSDSCWCTPRWYEDHIGLSVGVKWWELPDAVYPYDEDTACLYDSTNDPTKCGTTDPRCLGHGPEPGKCTTCEDANIPAPSGGCDCDNNGSTTVMTATLDWEGQRAVGSCGSEIWDASCHTNCAKSFTCSAPEAYDTIVYDASGTATTVTVCPTGTWNPGSAYCTEKDGKTSWCDGAEISLGLYPAEQSYWNAFCKDNPDRKSVV